MMNAFKFGTIVGGEFFTDRKRELETIKYKLDSENHIILISPRRYGKSSLVKQCLTETKKNFLWLDLQNVLSASDLATQLLKKLLKTFTYERLKYELSHFRIVPTFSTNAMTNDWQVSFNLSADSAVILEDVMQLMQKMATDKQHLVVVFDEFQEIRKIDRNLDRQLRSIMQHQQHINYIFMGSQESMMHEIFEQKKSPFYHFGSLMKLDKIPYDDFYSFIFGRLPAVRLKEDIVRNILSFTHCHPYYTQQLASQVWEKIVYEKMQENVVEKAISEVVQTHDLDYERLWNNFNRTDRSILRQLAQDENPMQDYSVAPSTTFSSLKRLSQNGIVVKTTAYELEDPFFKQWIKQQ
ncbi:MAG: ATP-binding protein [Paludibacteraceae bacterium]|nr:ATP-binding protein [Paludibacteraceae bacterium]